MTIFEKHLRGFITEMPRVGRRPQFTQLDPNRTAYELLQHLRPGDNVALLSRYPSTLKIYKDVMEERGFQVRIIEGQTGEEDFCFLMKTKKELIGQYASTFVKWAGVLSTTVRKVTLYKFDAFNGIRGEGKPRFNDDYLNKTFQFPSFS